MYGREEELTSLEVLVVVGQCLELLLRSGHCEGCADIKLWSVVEIGASCRCDIFTIE